MYKPVYKVAIAKYKTPFHSVREAVELSDSFKNMPKNARVVIKPNIVAWNTAADFPKWGVITTTRVIEDVCHILKEMGAAEITLLEGISNLDPAVEDPSDDASSKLGYNELGKRYGLKVVNALHRPFVRVDFDSFFLKFAEDAVNSDFIVNIPVLKTHAQCMVSLSLKNLKGLIDMPSRKKCHSIDPEHNLDYHIARLADKLPPMASVIDGIYTLERGPAFNGKAKRSDIIAASSDVISADKAGAEILGHGGKSDHIRIAARNHGRPEDLSDIEIIGEKIEDVTEYHVADFEYTPDGKMPAPLTKAGIKGISYPKYDLTLCTGCSYINGLIQTSMIMAHLGKSFNNIEMLTGKICQASTGNEKTILFGNCIIKANKNNSNIKEAIEVKGCPPQAEDIGAGMAAAGIPIDTSIFSNAHLGTSLMLAGYKDKPEFSEDFFRITRIT